MSGQATPPFAVRPLLPGDVRTLADIFRESVFGLTGDDYGEAQQGAWAALADDELSFGQRLAEALTIVATLGGVPVGFAALKGNDTIEFLYIHPAAAGQGAGAVLVDALERLAQARGATMLKVDASDTAYGFFVHRGYVAQRRNSVERGGEWLANTSMQKNLTPGAKS